MGDCRGDAQRQCKAHAGSAALASEDVDTAAVRSDDRATDGQAESDATVFLLGGLAAVEFLEHPGHGEREPPARSSYGRAALMHSSLEEISSRRPKHQRAWHVVSYSEPLPT